MAKMNTKVTLPNGQTGTTVSPVDKKGKQEVWISHTRTVKVDANKLT